VKDNQSSGSSSSETQNKIYGNIKLSEIKTSVQRNKDLDLDQQLDSKKNFERSSDEDSSYDW
jgi:hypothetical protein